MMTTIRSKTFDILFGLWTAVFGLLIPVLMIGHSKRIVRGISRLWVRGTLVLLDRVVGLGYVEKGRENRPDGPCIIVMNHQSTWETLASNVLFPNVAIVAKKELLRVPVFGWYLRRQPMITIDRDLGTQALRRMIDGARAAIAEGRPVLVYPEGTRKDPDEPISFRRGVEMIYAKLGVPVLPVVVNSGRFWGIAGGARRPGTITVSYLPAIAPGLSGAEMVAKASQAMEAERLRIG
ncbi:lysophospholipid acyltransferase family protein [Phreatobacter sp. AB_2022a]|uniref:lysophospholipid acyltransferase family protein n=1 Tax=Phreatobacter sp. AB_2022a TaxID=3003134 RepID=UPI002287069E|nr:lysophospholipid acyltransferase family protein [Phreatobacter sp. AB_2022a]MCZ0733066.1 lysophospholipid acyltransferase family protein [Phreatobacter sp. AB_2022a]